jgi:predicted nucleotidyltransferase
MDPDLEEYRKQAIATVKSEAHFIKETASDVLMLPVTAVYVVGSVLDRKLFREDSDIDVAVVVRGPRADTGLSESLSGRLQQEMVRWPLGEVGVVNTLVFVNELKLVRGKAMKVWVER